MMRTLILACLLALPAGAVEWPDCYCTNTQGERVELKQEACLTIGSRSFMGFCEMSQNVPIWRDTGRPCVTG